MAIAIAPTMHGQATIDATDSHVTLGVKDGEGRTTFTIPGRQYPLVLCDGTWDCPRRRNGDVDHMLDFADLPH